ncbi:MAG: ABC transporter permease [Candidatus Omnitrophica bacterium]|nr:ABC transporter permease [Candidatus Omnitrophota bacterium]
MNPVVYARLQYGDMVRRVGGFFTYFGGLAILSAETVFWTIVPPYRKRHILEQMMKMGVASFPIVFLISLFTGIVLALQSAHQMQRVSTEMYIASLVSMSLVRELGPVMVALIVAGRCGAAITAELGTMKVTEQIDALETLSADPVSYLVVPRFLALLIMLPLLTIYADFFGIVGGYLIGVYKLSIPPSMYVKMTFDPMSVKDLITGSIKSLSFAWIISIVSCYEGMNSDGGAEGVGKATTRSVVNSFIIVIIVDCFFTALFYFFG